MALYLGILIRSARGSADSGWPSYGRDNADQKLTPIDAINAGKVVKPRTMQ